MIFTWAHTLVRGRARIQIPDCPTPEAGSLSLCWTPSLHSHSFLVSQAAGAPCPRGIELLTSILKMSLQGVGSAMFVPSLVPQEEPEPGVANSYGHVFKTSQWFLGRGHPWGLKCTSMSVNSFHSSSSKVQLNSLPLSVGWT